MAPKKTDPTERFWKKVDKDGTTPLHRPYLGQCWIWRGSLNRSGYGSFPLSHRQTVPAHRASFFLQHGRWPNPCALHHCDNRSCVRPEHLFEGTKKDNALDAIAKNRFPFRLDNLTAPAIKRAKTHCPQGHEYTPENLVRRSRGDRDCKTCHRNRERLRLRKLKEAV